MAMAGQVNRATTKDTRGRNRTARGRIVVPSRCNCNFNCLPCPANLEMVPNARGVEASIPVPDETAADVRRSGRGEKSPTRNPCLPPDPGELCLMIRDTTLPRSAGGECPAPAPVKVSSRVRMTGASGLEYVRQRSRRHDRLIDEKFRAVPGR